MTPTVWGLLWLSDIAQLRIIAATNPYILKSTFRDIVSTAKIQLKCKSSNFIIFFQQVTNTEHHRDHRYRESSSSHPPTTPPNLNAPSNPATPNSLTPLEPLTPMIGSRKRKSTGSTTVNRSAKERALVKFNSASPSSSLTHFQGVRTRPPKCVLTHSGPPVQVAHICSFSLLQPRQADSTKPSFWDVLKTFWSPEKIDTWQEAIFHPGSTTGLDICSNLVTFSYGAHAYWNNALFALQPIAVSEDKLSLSLRFFWLLKYHHSSSIDLLTQPKTLHGLKGGLDYTGWYKFQEKRALEAGDIIRIITDNPETKPLPSLELLRMQWILTRLVALSAILTAIMEAEMRTNWWPRWKIFLLGILTVASMEATMMRRLRQIGSLLQRRVWPFLHSIIPSNYMDPRVEGISLWYPTLWLEYTWSRRFMLRT